MGKKQRPANRIELLHRIAHPHPPHPLPRPRRRHHRRQAPQTGHPRTSPLVAIEILSPEDRQSRIQQRIDDYLGIGTRFVWLIGLTARRAWVYTTHPIEEAKDGMIRVDHPAFTLPLHELFATIDRMTE
ncbi:MAG: Uma2 family endonuclease [Bryobacterales bacterium]|nr:Uma2 family endonuclease [Bryobacterales bacterium]